MIDCREIANWFKSSTDGKEARKKLSVMRQEKEVFPTAENLFSAYSMNYENPRILILNQYGYRNHLDNGIAFSTTDGSLTKELKVLFDCVIDECYPHIKKSEARDMFRNGNLDKWRKQGIMLFNYSLVQGIEEFDSLSQTLLDAVLNYDKPMAILSIRKPVKSSRHLVVNIKSIDELPDARFFEQAIEFLALNRPETLKQVFLEELVDVSIITNAMKKSIKDNGFVISQKCLDYIKKYFEQMHKWGIDFPSSFDLRTNV